MSKLENDFLSGVLVPAAQPEADPVKAEGTATSFLRDLAMRLRSVPVVHGVDQYDVDRLLEIAREMEG